MFLRTINIALSPNVTRKQNLAALGMLILPWKWFSWRDGENVKRLEARFCEMFNSDYALAVGSGREALLQILRAFKMEPGSEVILQSFTCMVVTNSLVWEGITPVYADIDSTYNLDPTDLIKKITPKTRAVIVQHTFGVPAQIEKIQKICKQNNLILIEDCAHALGATVGNNLVGSFGDVSFFSLGRSKVVSCVNGGVIISNDAKNIHSLRESEKNLKRNSIWHIAQNLFHPLITTLAKWFYFCPIGKIIMVVAQRLHLLNFEVTKQEKFSSKPVAFVSKMDNAMASLALDQIDILSEFNVHRVKAAQYYFDNLVVGEALDPSKFQGAIFLRYPLLVKNKKYVLNMAKKHGVILGDWYSSPIAPVDIDKSKTGYIQGSCPHTESLNIEVINLPTYYNLKHKDWNRVVNLINKYAKN